jgi:phosphatidylserine/phosphatidylglycerophosphate/cardiolipin synthase-like enzyme
MTDALIAPTARARFVVTLPPQPSRVAGELQRLASASFTTLTDTRDAFINLAHRARDRLVVMSPFIDASGADWASELFEQTSANHRVLILRGAHQLSQCGAGGERLRRATTAIHDYAFETASPSGYVQLETFHAKIVLADGSAAYVGSANLLHRSRELNLECGFLLDGDAVAPVAVLIDAVLAMFTS